MNIICLKCNSLLPPNNIYITTDLAKCDHCGAVLKVSELINHPKQIHPSTKNGSRITINLKKNGQLELSLSQKGFTPSIILSFLAAIFWLALITVLILADKKNIEELAFLTTPFWFLGVYITFRTYNKASETQKITFCDHTLKIDRISPVSTKTFETDFDDINAIKMKWRKSRPNVVQIKSSVIKLDKSKSVRRLKKAPAIITDEKTEFFFENANGKEQEWIIIILRNLVRQKNGPEYSHF